MVCLGGVGLLPFVSKESWIRLAAPRRILLFLAAVLLPHLRKIIIQPLVRKTDAEQPTSRQLNKLMRHEAHEMEALKVHTTTGDGNPGRGVCAGQGVDRALIGSSGIACA